MMKKRATNNYTQPKITRIVLDPEQAILAQCVVGGIYFSQFTNYCYKYYTDGTKTVNCGISIQGQRSATAAWTGIANTDQQPS